MKHLEQLILSSIPSFDLHLFKEAEFPTEPRLRLLQRAFYDLQQNQALWSTQRVIRERKAEEATQASSPDPVLPATSLGDQQMTLACFTFAHAVAQQLVKMVISHGYDQSLEKLPRTPLQWCDIDGVCLRTRVHVDPDLIWVYRPYDAIAEAARPISRVGMLLPPKSATGVAVTLWTMPIPSVLAHNRVLEAAELGRWALRHSAQGPQ